ncbi:hypothetical protein [Kitasatospora sp. NPDC094011]|uniref:hypothetical protein n=1 Tax=Kitasatospora sp. NPDC094011 TaxID=3364090 RepID=UPI0037F95C4F
MTQGDLHVAIDGHLEATTGPFETALTLLWQAVRKLPISGYQERYGQAAGSDAAYDDACGLAGDAVAKLNEMRLE